MAVKKYDYEANYGVPDALQEIWGEEMADEFDSIAKMPISREERMLRCLRVFPKTCPETYRALGAVGACRRLTNKVTRVYLPILTANKDTLNTAFSCRRKPQNETALDGIANILYTAERSLSETIEKTVTSACRAASGTMLEQQMTSLMAEIFATLYNVHSINNALRLLMSGADIEFDDDANMILDRAIACLETECNSATNVF